MVRDWNCQASAGQVVNAEVVSMSAPAIKYDQYEFAIPFGKAHACMSGLLNGLLRGRFPDLQRGSKK